MHWHVNILLTLISGIGRASMKRFRNAIKILILTKYTQVSQHFPENQNDRHKIRNEDKNIMLFSYMFLLSIVSTFKYFCIFEIWVPHDIEDVELIILNFILCIDFIVLIYVNQNTNYLAEIINITSNSH